MLTAIGRTATRRVLLPNRNAAPGLGLAKHLLREPAAHPNAAPLPASARTLIVSARLLSPKKTAAAATSATSTGGKAKKTTAAATKKKSAAPKKKKPAAKKKAAPKKKRVVKKKKAVKKKVVKKLTPEEKEAVQMRTLKKLALFKGPNLLPDSAWTVFCSNNIKSEEGLLGHRMKEISDKYSKLSEAEKERLQSIANKNSATNQDIRQKWINDHSPEAIYTANLARRRLARKLNKSRIYFIHDNRQPKRSLSSYSLFLKSKYPQASADFGTAPEAFRAMSKEWKTLTDSDKKTFQEESAKDSQRARAQFEKIREKAKAYLKAHELPIRILMH
ncbi:hypothetical protein E4U21_001336 [Claviceps maximensis]|nr:hypothetical protein E4U21_001336 [Claviceps maximensis]